MLVLLSLQSEVLCLPGSSSQGKRGEEEEEPPAFSPALPCIVPWTFQIGLNVVIEKIVSAMQMRKRSESASHASNFYVDNLP